MNDQPVVNAPGVGVVARLRDRVLTARHDIAVATPPRQFRQGDVLLQEASAVPHGMAPTPVPAERTVLALGELTGHAHVLSVAEGQLCDAGRANERFVTLSAEGTLTHEEHGAIVVPPGSYQVIRQREYRPGPRSSSAPRWAWVVE